MMKMRKKQEGTTESVEYDSLLHESFIAAAQNTIEKRMINLEESNKSEDLPNSEDDDDENSNAKKIPSKNLRRVSV